MKKTIISIAITLSLVAFTGCGNQDKQELAAESSQPEVSTVEESEKTFVDSAGREVTVPSDITKIAPSGPLAQMVLYTAAPDLLVGTANSFPEAAADLFPEKYLELPEFGQFYGKNASLNMEALSAAHPDVIIDIGEQKDTMKEDMDKLQEQLEIPTIFIEANLDSMGETYQMLGELLNRPKEADKLSEYCDRVLAKAGEVREKLGDNKKTVYYASGEIGLDTNAEGSFHAQVLETSGVQNAAVGVEIASRGDGTTISMEQLMQWQPEIILAASGDVYDLIMKDDTWKNLEAVKSGQVYQVPTIPYNFLGFPPSVNRIIGLQWLGNLVYPEEYGLDIEEEVKEFYDLFYHVDLKEDKLKEILENAG
ncbi:ABC transporter substrate-binding protein [Vagococcus elongatus]|uniref:ABC transporter substrate-binding protein n=1 Tax=Vagococcus elongatus TaxID=180344 RepID=A0A430AMK1_9ENTE|nr:ABC transporter substrate-binding protein [Vagococcus elongatus]RSU09348.1 ABC transporter substrate-binding protein [Vagococcus elongatus]